MKKLFLLLVILFLSFGGRTFADLKDFKIPAIPPKVMGDIQPYFLMMNCNGDITLPDDNGNTWYWQPCEDYLVFINNTPDRIFNYSITWLDASSTLQGQTGILMPSDTYTINGPMTLTYTGFSDILEQINRKAFWTSGGGGGGLSTDTIKTIPLNSFYATDSSSTFAVEIDKSWSYGDLFISLILILFLIFIIFGVIILTFKQ